MKTVFVEKEHLIFTKYHFVAAIRWRKLFVLDFKNVMMVFLQIL
jgi:hypothetical protein